MATCMRRKSPPNFHVWRLTSFESAALIVIGLFHVIGAVFRSCPNVWKFWNVILGKRFFAEASAALVNVGENPSEASPSEKHPAPGEPPRQFRPSGKMENP